MPRRREGGIVLDGVASLKDRKMKNRSRPMVEFFEAPLMTVEELLAKSQFSPEYAEYENLLAELGSNLVHAGCRAERSAVLSSAAAKQYGPEQLAGMYISAGPAAYQRMGEALPDLANENATRHDTPV